jgi:predicted nucleic acid-binding protein
MTAGLLVDTNLLVYAFDPSNRDKQARCARLLDVLATTGRGLLSTQVLGEFFRVVTEKIDRRLAPAEARRVVAGFADGWPVLPITAAIVTEAARGVSEFRLSYWDAQIWATARLNQVGTVLSEDFQDGRTIETVRFLDPLSSAFDLAAIP